MKIMKFGGTSVGKPERMHQVSQLITKSEEPTIVVLSALSGTTNALVGISDFLAKSDKLGASNQIETLEKYYRSFILDLCKPFCCL
jgi:aspartate kinase